VNAFEGTYNLPAFGEAMVQGAGSAMTLSATHLRTVALQTSKCSLRSVAPRQPRWFKPDNPRPAT
jgi:hypothetical protein